jgi:nicotinamide-nucleotide amidase
MIPELVETLFQRCVAGGLRVATAESCTGGMIAAAITDRAGSSAMFDRGFVTYSNQAKTEMLGVRAALIAAHGAVSAEVAAAMVRGALDHSPADAAVAVTGIAGPGGGSAEKPVGLVFIAAGRRGTPPTIERHVFQGDRAAIRTATVAAALRMLIGQLPG